MTVIKMIFDPSVRAIKCSNCKQITEIKVDEFFKGSLVTCGSCKVTLELQGKDLPDAPSK